MKDQKCTHLLGVNDDGYGMYSFVESDFPCHIPDDPFPFCPYCGESNEGRIPTKESIEAFQNARREAAELREPVRLKAFEEGRKSHPCEGCVDTWCNQGVCRKVARAILDEYDASLK